MVAFAGFSAMRAAKKSLDSSYAFIRHLSRFSLKRDRRNRKPEVKIKKSFLRVKKNRQNKKIKYHNWRTFVYSFFASAFILLFFYFMVTKSDLFSASHNGLCWQDLVKLLFIPALILFYDGGYQLYKIYENNKQPRMIKRKRIKKVILQKAAKS